ncbi:MAG TPA: hypothetical protein VMY35_04590 [Phycisphaerae bacterium]|nr:hypothetical protein [Phycisphaerae bacterium]
MTEMAEQAIPTREQLLESGLANDQGMVDVVAAIKGVKDNGHTYAKGQPFHMHVDLVGAHIAAGQIRLQQAPGTRQQAPGTKAAPAG